MSSFTGRLHKFFSTAASATSDTVISATKQAIATTPKPTKPISQLGKLKLLAKNFKKSSKNPSFRFRIPYYESTVFRLAAAKQFLLIEDILEFQKQFEDITNERFTVRIISLYGKAGMFDNARKLEVLFRDLPEKLGIKPDRVSYNTLIKSYCVMGSLESAVGVVELMESNGLEPDLITFNTLFDALYRNKKMDDAEKLWVLMESKNVVANVRSYNPKLRALVADDRISEAVDLVEEMRAKEVMPDIYSFNALIQGFCTEKNFEQAKRWYEELVKCDVAPDRVTYEIMLPFVCDMANFDYAFQLCKDVLNSRHRVSVSVIQRVVDGLAKDLKTEEAKVLVDLANANNYFHYKLKLQAEGSCRGAKCQSFCYFSKIESIVKRDVELRAGGG
ncbi:Pentatricopeptide repeat-containing protein [Heracleum sosnowskyi]|uniref:Pentatricopeptide repeat-containing protein n=1 Tax=Heracleum sosnowskyi TaxID=360622 RepID=A0AAD8MD35_9APIA|nr:Pentatricopeptide repeat-containing protein [Heracleum sosnowskyi]